MMFIASIVCTSSEMMEGVNIRGPLWENRYCRTRALS